MTGEQVAAAARELVGMSFRLHGRDPASGLDCVGVVAVSLAGAGWRGPVPSGYPLRGGDVDRIAALLDRLLPRVKAWRRAGDIVLAVPGPGQFHLLALTDGGFVHADAGLRRVVERPGPPPWPIAASWRYEGET